MKKFLALALLSVFCVHCGADSDEVETSADTTERDAKTEEAEDAVEVTVTEHDSAPRIARKAGGEQQEY